MNFGLRSTIPVFRLTPYIIASANDGIDPVDLYRWNSTLSFFLFDDVGTVEVVMRSVMAREFSVELGVEWFRHHNHFNDDTVKRITTAWTQGRLASLSAPADVVHGKLVASLLFGFWVKLLGRATTPVSAFQISSNLRRDVMETSPSPCLSWCRSTGTDRRAEAAFDVQTVRNRIAHHEHIIWGAPVYGQKNPDGLIIRIAGRRYGQPPLQNRSPQFRIHIPGKSRYMNTSQKPSVLPPSATGSTTTIITEATPHSKDFHQLAASPTSQDKYS